jgi:hypothetical protein
MLSVVILRRIAHHRLPQSMTARGMSLFGVVAVQYLYTVDARIGRASVDSVAFGY